MNIGEFGCRSDFKEDVLLWASGIEVILCSLLLLLWKDNDVCAGYKAREGIGPVGNHGESCLGKANFMIRVECSFTEWKIY